MARRKKSVAIKPPTRDKNAPYKVGDFCYYINVYDKVGFAEIVKLNEGYDFPVYTILDQTSYRYIVIEDMFCNDEESFFKKKKRKSIIEENKKW